MSAARDKTDKVIIEFTIEAIQGRLEFMDAMVEKACRVTRG